MKDTSLKKIKSLLPPLSSRQRPLKIFFVASESVPFAKAGGLGDVIYSLALALKKLDHDARIMIPRYGTIDPKEKGLTNEITGLKVPTDQAGEYPFLICNVKKYEKRDQPVFYFLENMEYYEKRANIYGYSDDHVRWVLLCRGAIEFLRTIDWQPDIIVTADWQTGLLANYLKTRYQNEPSLFNTPVLFTIHNLRYQGMCDFRFIKESEKDSGREPIPDFFNPRLAKLNWMLRGIMYSEAIVTVSPTYAKEILTPEYGEGLEKILKEKQHRLWGILNGLDYHKYNPNTSPHIPVHYNKKTAFIKKKENKIQLQKRMGLKQDENAFLVGIVSRLTEQKGFDLLEEIIDHLFENLPLQIVLVGDGESRYKEMLQNIAQKYSNRLGYLFEFNTALPHLIFAGADAILIPSKFEPCGIVQMQAMRYGAIPIVRKTGGLADTVKDFNPVNDDGTGFVFEKYNPWALYTAIVRASSVFQIKTVWKELIRKAMEQDFSWQSSAKKYLQIFFRLLDEKNTGV